MGGVEAFPHDGDECGVDEFADEFGRGVVGAGLLAFGARGEVEGALVLGDAGGVVEQGFVDGAEFFDVEVGVVDAAEALVFGAVVGEVADGLEELVVGAFGGFEVLAGGFGEEFAVEGGESDDAGGAFVAADAEGLAEADPEVGVVVVLAGAVGAFAEASDAVVAGEDGVFVRVGVGVGVGVAGEEFAFFGDHEEEEAVDEVEQLAVELGGVEFAVLEGLAELGVVFAPEDCAAEGFEGLLDAVAEFVADASAFFDALLVEAFEGALVRGRFGPREAGAVEQAVEEDEVGVGVVADHGFEVELEPGGAGASGGVAEDADAWSVGEDAPEGFGAVEEVLELCVGAAAGALGPAVEIGVGADDVNGCSVFGVVGAAVDVEGCAADFDVGALEVEAPEAEAFEHRLDEGFAGHGVRVGAPLPSVPEGADIGEGGLGFVGEAGGFGEAEVLRALVGCAFALGEAVEQIGREEAAFAGDGFRWHRAQSPAQARGRAGLAGRLRAAPHRVGTILLDAVIRAR